MKLGGEVRSKCRCKICNLNSKMEICGGSVSKNSTKVSQTAVLLLPSSCAIDVVLSLAESTCCTSSNLHPVSPNTAQSALPSLATNPQWQCCCQHCQVSFSPAPHLSSGCMKPLYLQSIGSYRVWSPCCQEGWSSQLLRQGRKLFL